MEFEFAASKLTRLPLRCIDHRRLRRPPIGKKVFNRIYIMLTNKETCTHSSGVLSIRCADSNA